MGPRGKAPAAGRFLQLFWKKIAFLRYLDDISHGFSAIRKS